jgi:predicted negative regulator of RcsB-dependent stress response
MASPKARTEVDAQTRTALKKDDPLVHTTQAGLDWIAANRSKALRIGLAILALIVIAIVAAVVYQQRSQAAENAFGAAMSIYSTPIADPQQQLPPGARTFPNAAERAKTARPQFEAVANQYGSTDAGHNARYFAGVTAAEMGDVSGAEATLRKAAGGGDSNVASLAKLALSNLLAQHGNSPEAVKLYQELINHPTSTVPASAAQLQLAQLYETTNPAEANKLYAQIKAKDTKTAAGQIAAQRLAGQH